MTDRSVETSDPNEAPIGWSRPASPGTVATDPPKAFGFITSFGGVHTSRTMMLKDLQGLLASAPAQATHNDFRRAIVEENALGKRTVTTRRRAAQVLGQLYALDPGVAIFRALRFFWDREPPARPLLALLCANGRDPILRLTAKAVLSAKREDVVDKSALEETITDAAPGHFAPSTVQKIARNAGSTWTQSGHLQGQRVKRRSRPKATPAGAAYALLLGYLAGASGQMLLSTFWAQLLDTPKDQLASLAVDASARGWISYRQSGQVVEVRFPDLLTPEEMEIRREQD